MGNVGPETWIACVDWGHRRPSSRPPLCCSMGKKLIFLALLLFVAFRRGDTLVSAQHVCTYTQWNGPAFRGAFGLAARRGTENKAYTPPCHRNFLCSRLRPLIGSLTGVPIQLSSLSEGSRHMWLKLRGTITYSISQPTPSQHA